MPKRSFIQSWLPLAVMILVAACAHPFYGVGGDVITVIFAGSVLSTACLIGTGFGIANSWWRFPAAPFAIIAPAFAIGAARGIRFDVAGAIITAAIPFVVFTTLECVKFFFGKFKVQSDEKPTKDGLQFGIGQLMIITTSVAVFISVIKFLTGFFDDDSRSLESFLIGFMFVAILGFFTLANVWALMGSAVRHRLLIVVAASVVAVIPSFFVAPDSTILIVWISLFAVCWSMIALQLWLLRRTGLRFVRN